ncbi:MAG: hypothetical protein B6D56_05660 [Candidatus Omnitrophica bacterium 4484_70.1]|nr:MAG: hypothetical protein B6D56_05660 [Candidatus Omnitrophica bacterium 4484_70.1]
MQKYLLRENEILEKELRDEDNLKDGGEVGRVISRIREIGGVEDFRFSIISDTFYMTFTAQDWSKLWQKATRLNRLAQPDITGGIEILKHLATRAPPKELLSLKSASFQALINYLRRHEESYLKGLNEAATQKLNRIYFLKHPIEYFLFLISLRLFGVERKGEVLDYGEFDEEVLRKEFIVGSNLKFQKDGGVISEKEEIVEIEGREKLGELDYLTRLKDLEIITEEWRRSDGEIVIPPGLAPVISMLGEEIFKEKKWQLIDKCKEWGRDIYYLADILREIRTIGTSFVDCRYYDKQEDMWGWAEDLEDYPQEFIDWMIKQKILLAELPKAYIIYLVFKEGVDLEKIKKQFSSNMRRFIEKLEREGKFNVTFLKDEELLSLLRKVAPKKKISPLDPTIVSHVKYVKSMREVKILKVPKELARDIERGKNEGGLGLDISGINPQLEDKLKGYLEKNFVSIDQYDGFKGNELFYVTDRIINKIALINNIQPVYSAWNKHSKSLRRYSKYGGYIALKALEANASKLGIERAEIPPSSWIMKYWGNLGISSRTAARFYTDLPVKLGYELIKLGNDVKVKGYGGRYNLPQFIWGKDFNPRREEKKGVEKEERVFFFAPKELEERKLDGGNAFNNKKDQPLISSGLVSLRGKPLGKFILDVDYRPDRRIKGFFNVKICLKDTEGNRSTPVIDHGFYRGDKYGFFQFDYSEEVEFDIKGDKRKVSLSDEKLDRKLFEFLGRAIPPGGQMMISYLEGSKIHKLTRNGLLIHTPAIVTPLGKLIFFAGVINLKTEKSGVEGRHRIEGEKPLDKKWELKFVKKQLEEIKDYLGSRQGQEDIYVKNALQIKEELERRLSEMESEDLELDGGEGQETEKKELIQDWIEKLKERLEREKVTKARVKEKSEKKSLEFIVKQLSEKIMTKLRDIIDIFTFRKMKGIEKKIEETLDYLAEDMAKIFAIFLGLVWVEESNLELDDKLEKLERLGQFIEQWETQLEGSKRVKKALLGLIKEIIDKRDFGVLDVYMGWHPAEIPGMIEEEARRILGVIDTLNEIKDAKENIKLELIDKLDRAKKRKVEEIEKEILDSREYKTMIEEIEKKFKEIGGSYVFLREKMEGKSSSSRVKEILKEVIKEVEEFKQTVKSQKEALKEIVESIIQSIWEGGYIVFLSYRGIFRLFEVLGAHLFQERKY